MLAVGDTAPQFSLPDAAGNDVTLASLLTENPLILFFYPADFTPVCTREACLFRDAYADIAERGLLVAGISPDDVETHARFRDRHSLTYPLLADPEKKVVSAYGALGPFGIVRRTTYLIDADRGILSAVRADLRLSPHSRLLEKAIDTRADRMISKPDPKPDRTY
jgi:peroxiredoxin Q/BCP